jgi:hypothetical protein
MQTVLPRMINLLRISKCVSLNPDTYHEPLRWCFLNQICATRAATWSSLNDSEVIRAAEWERLCTSSTVVTDFCKRHCVLLPNGIFMHNYLLFCTQGFRILGSIMCYILDLMCEWRTLAIAKKVDRCWLSTNTILGKTAWNMQTYTS